jgi:hypothetical protein
LEFEETETALIVSKCLDEIINMISKWYFFCSFLFL